MEGRDFMTICRKINRLQVAILQEHKPKIKRLVLKLLRSPTVFTLTSMHTRASSTSVDVFGFCFYQMIIVCNLANVAITSFKIIICNSNLFVWDLNPGQKDC